MLWGWPAAITRAHTYTHIHTPGTAPASRGAWRSSHPRRPRPAGCCRASPRRGRRDRPACRSNPPLPRHPAGSHRHRPPPAGLLRATCGVAGKQCVVRLRVRRNSLSSVHQAGSPRARTGERQRQPQVQVPASMRARPPHADAPAPLLFRTGYARPITWPRAGTGGTPTSLRQRPGSPGWCVQARATVRACTHACTHARTQGCARAALNALPNQPCPPCTPCRPGMGC